MLANTPLLTLLALLGGAITGGAIAIFTARATYQVRLSAQQRLADANQRVCSDRLDERELQLQSSEQSLQNERDKNAELNRKNATIQALLESERRQTAEKMSFQDKQRSQLKVEFETLAQRILEEKSERFAKQNLDNIGTILRPLRDQIGDFKKRVEDVYDKESKERTRLSSEILHLKNLNERISEDAIKLTNALKGDSKTRGNWGEIVLERILEDAGLREGYEFEREVQLVQSDGGRGRPDVIIHLPDRHDLIVDAKVSLRAFEEAMSLNPGEARNVAMKKHVQSMREHIKSLSNKSYNTLLGVNSLDFVLMFVPIEPALHAAFAESPEIFQEAYDKNIFIVSPTTLLMACRTVQNIWRTEAQSKNSLEISQQAAKMLDKFTAFVEDIDNVGKYIEQTHKTYKTARNKLADGHGNLINRAKKIEQLGAKGRKKLPEV